MKTKNWQAEDILALRKRYGLTRKQLGELLGVNLMSIYLWENRLRNPSKTAQILLSYVERELKEKKKEEKYGKRNL